ncbi:MAG: phosphatase [Methylophilaceae bacterium 17-44-8]|nr:MAG: phosphatase [Methylophilaceae bacterium 17-44-8]
MMYKQISLAVLAALSFQAQAADNTYFDNFTPLAGSQTTALPQTAPALLSSPNFSQVRLADRAGSGVAGSNWDMIDADATGRYLFMPFETSQGGVMRVDLQDSNYATRTTTIVAPGTQGFVSGDASRTTPWGSYLTAEESWGAGSTKGRLFEVTNPTTAGANTGNFVQRSVIPRVSHEGLAFDAANNLYFIDEFNGGSIYKYTSSNPTATSGNDYFASGQTFVAKVNGGSNANAVGTIAWEAITNATGGAIAGSALATDGTIDGRVSANNVGGTDYQRPEDLETKVLANGDEVMFIATTTTNEVYMFNFTSNTASLFANTNTIDLATGNAVGASAFTSPDNLAIDANGNIYIIEDRNGAVDNDIWFAKDLNNDGDLLDAGEGMGRWASNGIPGSEFTGLYFDKNDPNVAYFNIQHPTGGNDSLIQVTAVPEPESYAMFLAGLGLMGVSARRHNQKK